MVKRVTMQNVADEAKVSLASVSLFLNNRPGLSDETRAHIGEAVRKLGYTHRRGNGNGANTKASLIGLVVERLPFSMFSDLHYGEVLHSVEASARRLGYHLSLVVVEPEQGLGPLRKHLEALSGIIILGAGDITEVTARQLLDIGKPVLLVDAHYPSLKVDCVLVDNLGGAQQAVAHLLGRGYRRIACIQGPDKYPSLVERFQGYCHALLAAGLRLEPSIIQPPISKGYPHKGYREMRALLERRESFDAVFCVSDRAALGALQALQEARLRVPEDVALVGFEDVPQVGHTAPPLTTVEMPKSALGEAAVRQLHAMLREGPGEPMKRVLYTSLIVRKSS